MSSLLNASNDSDIEVFLDSEEQNWFKRAYVGNFLEIENIVNSRKDKGKALKEHIFKDIAPRGFNAEIEGIQEKHRLDMRKKMQPLHCLMMIYKIANMRTWHYKHKGMYIRLSYKDVKIPSRILGHAIFLMQEIQTKATLSLL